jgi:hypothetical protein
MLIIFVLILQAFISSAMKSEQFVKVSSAASQLNSLLRASSSIAQADRAQTINSHPLDLNELIVSFFQRLVESERVGLKDDGLRGLVEILARHSYLDRYMTPTMKSFTAHRATLTPLLLQHYQYLIHAMNQSPKIDDAYFTAHLQSVELRLRYLIPSLKVPKMNTMPITPLSRCWKHTDKMDASGLPKHIAKDDPKAEGLFREYISLLAGLNRRPDGRVNPNARTQKLRLCALSEALVPNFLTRDGVPKDELVRAHGAWMTPVLSEYMAIMQLRQKAYLRLDAPASPDFDAHFMGMNRLVATLQRSFPTAKEDPRPRYDMEKRRPFLHSMMLPDPMSRDSSREETTVPIKGEIWATLRSLDRLIENMVASCNSPQGILKGAKVCIFRMRLNMLEMVTTEVRDELSDLTDAQLSQTKTMLEAFYGLIDAISKHSDAHISLSRAQKIVARIPDRHPLRPLFASIIRSLQGVENPLI